MVGVANNEQVGLVQIVEMYNFVSEGPTLRWISKSGGLWCSQLGLGLGEGLCLSRRGG